MITPRQLFYKRLVSEWRFQYTAWKPAVDWTVALYILLPATALGLYGYLSLWRQPPAWLALIPLNGLMIVVFYFAWSGTVRIFIEEADQLFLWQCRDWIRQLIGFGLGYSAAVNLLLTILLFALLAPVLLLHFRLSWAQSGLLAAITFLLKMDLGLARRLMTSQQQSWPLLNPRTALFLISGVAFTWAIRPVLNSAALCLLATALLLFLFIILIRARINSRGIFQEDVAREASARLRYASFALRASGVNIKKPGPQRRCPWLWSRSQPLFGERNPVNCLTETCIKLFLRNLNELKLYLLLSVLCVAFAWPYGAWAKLAVWCCYAVLFAGWSSFYWQHTAASDFMSLLRWKQADLSAAARKSIFILMLPGFLLAGLVLGFQAFSWPGALATLPAAVPLGYLATRFVSRFL